MSVVGPISAFVGVAVVTAAVMIGGSLESSATPPLVTSGPQVAVHLPGTSSSTPAPLTAAEVTEMLPLSTIVNPSNRDQVLASVRDSGASVGPTDTGEVASPARPKTPRVNAPGQQVKSSAPGHDGIHPGRSGGPGTAGHAGDHTTKKAERDIRKATKKADRDRRKDDHKADRDRRKDDHKADRDRRKDDHKADRDRRKHDHKADRGHRGHGHGHDKGRGKGHDRHR